MTGRREFLKTGAGAAAALATLASVRQRFLDDLAAASPGLPDRSAYLLDPQVRYLNHGSIGTIPRLVHEAHVRYLRVCETNPWLYMWSEPWVEPIEEVRRRASSLMGVGAEDMVLTHNTTEAFNLLAHGLPLGPGDEVLYSSLNHPGASNPWTHMAPVRGFSVREFQFPVEETPGLSPDDVVALHIREIRPETRVLVFPHVDNLVGLRHPMAALARAARRAGVEVIAVDGAQTLSMIPVDLGGTEVDVYAGSPHKWVQAPKGLGVAYLRGTLQERLHPMWVSSGQPAARGSVRRFEDYGTRNRPEVLTLGSALAFQERMGPATKEAAHRRHWQEIRERVEATPELRWHSPTDWGMAAALYTVEVRGRSAFQVADELWDRHRITVRPIRIHGTEGLRLSPNHHTDPAEVEAFFRAVGA
ncbi:MAG: aminotransferase class V-fold PLP-dependent enzyme [Gemmatimonadales bacterium]|nr:MAG: aminotransferase class V-fold PLP-dependent enzyme [Gemmatimonadales bacterium]